MPSIISFETYESTQGILKSRSANGRGKKNAQIPFSKKLKYGHCGKGYIKSILIKMDEVTCFTLVDNVED